MNKIAKILALTSVSLLSVISPSQSAIAENISPDNIAEQVLPNPSVDSTLISNLPVTVQDLKLSNNTSSSASDLINKADSPLAQTPESTDTPAPETPIEIPASPDIQEPQPSFGSSVTIIPQISTLGAGLGLATPINGNLMARVGLNYTGFGTNVTSSSVNAKVNLNLFSVSALVDYYPFGLNSFFALTGGLAYQNNRINGQVRSGSIEVDGTTYNVPSDSGVDGTINFPNNFSPYLGITLGGSNGNKGGLGFFANLGVLFSGTPQSNISSFGSINSLIVDGRPFTEALASERVKFQDEINKNIPGIYPVLSIGLTYQF